MSGPLRLHTPVCVASGGWEPRWGLPTVPPQTRLQSRVRTLLANANLPPLETQILVGDELGPIFTHAHMGWRQWRVVVQCDEDLDWTVERRTWQFEYTEDLERIGWRNVWVTAPMMREPRRVVWRVNEAIQAARRRLPTKRGAERDG
ncbi:hypothetical protein [Mycobacterium sp. HM-7]